MYRTVVTLAACLLIVGCTLEQGEPPTFTAPSEFALSVTLSASPDSVPRDGASQSVVTVTVRDAAGNPVAGQRLTLSTSSGQLSASSATTASDGQATFTFTAPSVSTTANSAVIGVVPIGTDGANAAQRNLTILLTGTTNRTLPTPAFSFTPTAPQANAAVRFDASATTDEGAPCLDACTYSWTFGDGTTGSGRIVSKTFTIGGTRTVTLTVTDGAGSSASAAQQVTVTTVPAPTVTFAASPNPPLVGQQATFTATPGAASQPITRYEWTFGDGTSTTTTAQTVNKTFTARGTYIVTVTVTDSFGQTASASNSYTITSAGVTASFTSSPTNPVPAQTVQFNGASSTGAAGASISTYAWDFGDGSTTEGSSATASHAYTLAGTYVVRLTVTDSGGRTGTTTANVTVAEAD